MSERPNLGSSDQELAGVSANKLSANNDSMSILNEAREGALQSLKDREAGLKRELMESGVPQNIIIATYMHTRNFVDYAKKAESDLETSSQTVKIVNDFIERFAQKDRVILSLSLNQLVRNVGQSASNNIYEYSFAVERRLVFEKGEGADLDDIMTKKERSYINNISHFPKMLKAIQDVDPDWLLGDPAMD